MGRSRTPSLLPHQGGGASPLFELDGVIPTGRHLPLDGGGWEGVTYSGKVCHL
jgi:hypothetical protein